VSVDAPGGYELGAVPNERVDTMRALIEEDGVVTDAQWTAFIDLILPDGFLVARERETSEAVGTISAVHNPHGARFYFPGGGALGYLVVNPAHRGRGLGHALVSAAVDRLRTAGYRTIWLGVHDWRDAAIRTYLAAGFIPFLHGPDPHALAARWRAIFDRLFPSAGPDEH
jgi:ribosomal protein S18 acetylase RimI-like enzyme